MRALYLLAVPLVPLRPLASLPLLLVRRSDDVGLPRWGASSLRVCIKRGSFPECLPNSNCSHA